MVSADKTCLRLLTHSELFAESRERNTTGERNPARMQMMLMTTNISNKVKWNFMVKDCRFCDETNDCSKMAFKKISPVSIVILKMPLHYAEKDEPIQSFYKFPLLIIVKKPVKLLVGLAGIDRLIVIGLTSGACYTFLAPPSLRATERLKTIFAGVVSWSTVK